MRNVLRIACLALLIALMSITGCGKSGQSPSSSSPSQPAPSAQAQQTDTTGSETPQEPELFTAATFDAIEIGMDRATVMELVKQKPFTEFDVEVTLPSGQMETRRVVVWQGIENNWLITFDPNNKVVAKDKAYR